MQTDILMGCGGALVSSVASGTLPAVPEPMIREEAGRVLVLAQMHNIDLADLLPLAGSSRTTQVKTEEEQFHKQQKMFRLKVMVKRTYQHQYQGRFQMCRTLPVIMANE